MICVLLAKLYIRISLHAETSDTVFVPCILIYIYKYLCVINDFYWIRRLKTKIFVKPFSVKNGKTINIFDVLYYKSNTNIHNHKYLQISYVLIPNKFPINQNKNLDSLRNYIYSLNSKIFPSFLTFIGVINTSSLC